MTTLTAPAPQANSSTKDEQPIRLFQLGALFVVRTRYWTCKAGNEANELNLSPGRSTPRPLPRSGQRI